MHLNHWDITLILIVSIQATLIAYVRQPQTKALLITFPFPFSVAYLALGHPIDATNMLGLLLLLVFIHAVRWLYIQGKCHIVIAIILGALIYSIIGTVTAKLIPRQEWVFWLATGVTLTIALLLLQYQPHRNETRPSQSITNLNKTSNYHAGNSYTGPNQAVATRIYDNFSDGWRCRGI